MKLTYNIFASTTAAGLTGHGDELLIDAVDGSILARFYNGNFMVASSSLSPVDAAQGSAATIVITKSEAA